MRMQDHRHAQITGETGGGCGVARHACAKAHVEGGLARSGVAAGRERLGPAVSQRVDTGGADQEPRVIARGARLRHVRDREVLTAHGCIEVAER